MGGAVRTWLAALALVVLGGMGAQAQTTYFSSNCDGAAYPLCGFATEDTTNHGVYVNRTRVADGCPDGTDAVHFEMIPTSTFAQFYYGWDTGTISGFNAANGGTFYLKYRIRPNASINWSGVSPESVFYQKFILWPGDVDTQRLITDLRDNGANDTAGIRSQLNVGGGATGGLTLGAWNAVIQGYTLATTDSANDGALRTWIATSGTFNVGSPTTSNTGLDIEDETARTSFYLGHYTQTTLASGGSFGYDICNVVLTDTFDANWPTIASTGQPVRIRIRGDAAALPFAFVVPWLAWRRRQR